MVNKSVFTAREAREEAEEGEGADGHHLLRPSRGEHGGARAHQRDAQRKVSIVFFPVFHSQSLSSSCFPSVFINVLLREGSGSNILAVGPGARIVEVSQFCIVFTIFSLLISLKYSLAE